MPPVGFKLRVLLYVQSVKDGGQWTWSSVKHRLQLHTHHHLFVLQPLRQSANQTLH